MVHQAHQLKHSEQHFKKLPSNDISVQYYNGTKTTTLTPWDKINMFLFPGKYYSELNNFYPYQKVIKASYQTFQEQAQYSLTKGLKFSAVAIFVIYQMGKRGFVLPVLRKYGTIFNTHRIFRHYIYALVLPSLWLLEAVHEDHYKNLTQLWSVHSRRMAQKLLTDPQGTEYPENLKTSNIFWKSNTYSMLDIYAKIKSEVPLQQSQLYENPEFETVDFGEVGVEQTEQ